MDLEPAPPLRAIMFATKSGSRYESWYALKDSISKCAAGEVSYRLTCWDKTDPVQSYLVVRLKSGMIFEAVGLREEPDALVLYVQGSCIGQLLEKEVEKAAVSWWRRLMGGERLWHFVLRDQLIGYIELKYPVSKTTRLLFHLHNRESLPIGVASVWGREETRFVIPPDAPQIDECYLERVHFLLAIIFRVLICHVDLSSS